MSENTINKCFKWGGYIKEDVTVEEGLEENIQPMDITREEHDGWMADYEHESSVTLTEDVCEAIASTSKATQAIV